MHINQSIFDIEDTTTRYRFLQNVNVLQQINDDDESDQQQVDYITQLHNFVDQQHDKVRRKKLNHSLIFDPENTFFVSWQLVNLICIMTYFLQLPISIAFNSSYREHEDTATLFHLVNMFCIVIFTLNIGVRMKTSYYQKGILINDSKKILKHYIRYSILLDIVTLASIMPHLLEIGRSETNMFIEVGQYRFLAALFYLKIFEAMQIINSVNQALQLHRRTNAIFNFWLLLTIIILISSCYACIFFSISANYCANEPPVDGHNICWIQSVEAAGIRLNHQSTKWYVQYSYSLYWAATTMISIGYGDITPKNINEVLFTIFTQFSSCVLYAYTLNRIWEVKRDLYEKEQIYSRKVNVINRYMRDKNVNSLLKNKIMNYLAHFYKKQKIRHKEEENQIIEQLAPALKEELLMETYGFIFTDHDLFKSFSPEFLADACYKIQQVRFSENEIIYQPEFQQINYSLYYVYQGQVQTYIDLGKRKKILDRLGPTNLLNQYSFFTGLCPNSKIVATCYSFLYVLKVSDWTEVLKQFIKDFEQYHFMRDSAAYQKNMKLLRIYCKFCHSYTHLSCQCTYERTKQDHIVFIRNYRCSANQRRQHLRSETKNQFVLRSKDSVNRFKLSQKILLSREIYYSEYYSQNEYNSDISQGGESSGFDMIVEQEVTEEQRRAKKRKFSLQDAPIAIKNQEIKGQNRYEQEKRIKIHEQRFAFEEAYRKPLQVLHIDKKESYQKYFKERNLEFIIDNAIIVSPAKISSRLSEFRKRD